MGRLDGSEREEMWRNGLRMARVDETFGWHSVHTLLYSNIVRSAGRGNADLGPEFVVFNTTRATDWWCLEDEIKYL